MKIIKIEKNKNNYLPLLLIADPSEDMVDRYLEKGDLFVMEDEDEIICIAVVIGIEDKKCELKNISVAEKHQIQGYGKMMVEYLLEYYKPFYRKMLVGTADISLGCIPFYTKCGFARSHTVKGFFTDNYPEPIYENGIKLEDMVYLSKEL